MARAAKKFYDLAHAAVASGQKDNSHGAGHWPLPARLSNVQSFILCSNKLLPTHTVFPDDNVHMFTAKVDTSFGILEGDLRTLGQLGLVRIQCNDPGKISLYFKGEPWKESDWR